MRSIPKIICPGIVIALFINLIGCAGIDKIPPLELPSSDIINGLKSYNRYTFKYNQRTNQNIEKGDMVLIFVSGAGSTDITPHGFQIEIGKSPSFKPLSRVSERGNYYGYFMASFSGKLNLSYRQKYYAGNAPRRSRYCQSDVFIFPESSEPNIFVILEKFISKNPEDYFFRMQVDQFVYHYQWLIYTKIEIESSPSFANVYLDGKHVGKTPIEMDKINKHYAHNICVKLDKYSEHCESFSPKEKSRFNIVLKKLPSVEHENITQLAKLKEKWQKEQREADLLREKLSKVTEEKETLAVKLESETDVRKQLESSLKERETALKRKETLVESLYEKERQLKSKNLQLELAQGRSEEYKRQLEILNQKANQMDKELKLAKSKEATAIAEDELNKILTEKSNLQKEANNLKEKEAKLRSEVSNLSAVAEKTRTEAERAKKELTSMRKRETQLIDQVAQLKTRLSKGMAPVLIITKPKQGLKIQSSTTMLHLIAVDDRGINSINVSLNGESLELSDARGIVLGDVDKVSIGKRFDIKERLHLQYGRNTIEVSVTDTDGLSQEEIINIIREKERGDIWAVVIGINQYQNKRNLKYAVNDANMFKNYLMQYIGIPEENLFFLTNQNATRSNIQSVLGTQLRRKASKDDTVIIFYAGHGGSETDPGNPDGDGFEKYLLPYDAKLDDLYSSAIPMRDIKNIFQRIRSDRLIFIADTCYSGAAGGRTMIAFQSRATLSEKFFERISKGKGRVIISSSSANEISKEDDKLQHGIFSYYLLEGLKGQADHDSDGIITVSELFSFLSRKVPEASGQDQHPVRKGETEGELVIGRVK